MDDDGRSSLHDYLVKQASLIERGELVHEQQVASNRSIARKLRDVVEQVQSVSPQARPIAVAEALEAVERCVDQKMDAVETALPVLLGCLAAAKDPGGMTKARDLVSMLEVNASNMETLALAIRNALRAGGHRVGGP
jgi:hypothetical protein